MVFGLGSKWTMHVDGSTNKIYDEDKAFTVNDDFIIKSVIHKRKFSNSLNQIIKSGYSNNLSRLFRYARDNWSRGVDDIDFTYRTVNYSDVSSDEVIAYGKDLMRTICSIVGESFSKYESLPPGSMPLNSLSARGYMIPDSPKNNDISTIDSAIASLFYKLPKGFSGPDILTGNIKYTDTSGSTHILNTSDDLANKFIIENVDDKYFIATIPFVKEGPFLAINPPRQTGTYTLGGGDNIRSYPIYTVFYDRSKITKIDGKVISSNTEIRPAHLSTITVTIEPKSNYGKYYSSDYWDFRKINNGIWYSSNSIVPYRDNYSGSININNLPLFDFGDELREEIHEGRKFLLRPNQVVLRKKSKVIILTGNVNSSETNIHNKSYERSYSTAIIDETVANILEFKPTENKYPKEYFRTFPSLPIRDRSGWRHQMNVSYVESRLSKIVGMDIKQVSKEIWDDADDARGIMQFIYFHNYIDSKPKHDEVEVIEFLYRYMNLLEEIQIITPSRVVGRYLGWLSYEPEEGSYKGPFYPPRNNMDINSHGTGNECSIWFTCVVKTEYTGTHKQRYFYKVNDSGTRNRIGSKHPSLLSAISRTPELLTYCRRDGNKILETTVIGLTGYWGITSYTHRGGWDRINHVNGRVLMPIPIGLWNETSILIKEAVAARTAHITYLAAQWNKTSGWKRFIGSAIKVLRIVSIALTIGNVVAGALTNAALSGATSVAGNIIFNKLVTELVINYVKNKLVSYVISVVSDKLNIPYLSYIYDIFNTFSGEIDFNITNVLKLTNSFSSIAGSYLENSISSLVTSLQEDAEYWNQATKELEEAQKNFNLGRNDKILEVLVESPEKFFGRTFADTIEASFSILENDYLFNFDLYLE